VVPDMKRRKSRTRKGRGEGIGYWDAFGNF